MYVTAFLLQATDLVGGVAGHDQMLSLMVLCSMLCGAGAGLLQRSLDWQSPGDPSGLPMSLDPATL